MLRRGFLASAGVVSTGCLSQFGFGSGRALQLRRVNPVEQYAASTGELDARERDAVEATVDGGSYTVYGADPRPPFHEVRYVEHDGVYYSVETDETETRTMNRDILRAERVNGTPTEDAVEPDAYGDDRGTVVRAYRRAAYPEPDSPVPDFVPVRSPPNETELLPEPEHRYVVVGDSVVYRLSAEERQLEERGFDVTTERVADNDAQLRRRIDEEKAVAIDADELPDEQRRVLDAATETGSYTEPSGGSDALDTVLERMDGGDLIRYRGDYYDPNVAGP
jgi:hypothetical protein